MTQSTCREGQTQYQTRGSDPCSCSNCITESCLVPVFTGCPYSMGSHTSARLQDSHASFHFPALPSFQPHWSTFSSSFASSFQLFCNSHLFICSLSLAHYRQGFSNIFRCSIQAVVSSPKREREATSKTNFLKLKNQRYVTKSLVIHSP